MRSFTFAAFLVLPVFCAAESARADDMKPSPSPVPSSAEPAVLPAKVVDFRGVGRFRVMQHDRKAGLVTIRLVDSGLRVANSPVVTMPSDSGPQTLTFVPVEGEPGTWRLTSPLFRAAGSSGSTMRIVVGDKTYSAPFLLASTSTPVPAPLHGGRILALSPCDAFVEVVRDLDTGTLVIYAPGMKLSDSPAVVVEGVEPDALKVVSIEGQPGAWSAANARFKDPLLAMAFVRVTVDGHVCEADIADGRVVAFESGLHLQVAQAKGSDTYLVRAIETQIDGKPYALENPHVVVAGSGGERTVNMVPIEGQARTWRLVMPSGAPEGILKFTLGKRKEEALIIFADAR